MALKARDIQKKTAPNDLMGSPIERTVLTNILELGLTDAFRLFNQEAGQFSWWDYRSGGFTRNRGWRIDHHYVTPKLKERAIACTIDTEPRKLPKPSDHTPVILELE